MALCGVTRRYEALCDVTLRNEGYVALSGYLGLFWRYVGSCDVT